jgi:hypothetical protein
MSTAAVSTSSIYQQLQTYFHARNSDLQQLGKALQSGDLSSAQQEFNAIKAMGQSGPFANGEPFKISQRDKDFAAVGQALQSGDLAGAQQAFAQLKSTFQHKSTEPTPASIVSLSAEAAASSASSGSSDSQSTASSTAASAASATSGGEIVLNLGNVTPGEQITIGLSSGSNGGEQVTIGVSGKQNQTPEQITLNLSSNQQIILNLFNSTASNAAQDGGVSLTA